MKPLWQQCCIPATATIRDALACIEGNVAKIALVTDEAGMLLETITDGDIRRAILAGMEFSTLATSLHSTKGAAYREPVTAAVDADPATLLRLLRGHAIRQVPLLDAQRRLAGLVTLEDLLQEGVLPVHAVVMAGGFGLRLRPLTDDMPKPMLPVGDRPLLELIVERLRHAGIRRISLLTHYKREAISEHFGDGSRFDVGIDYVEETEPLGTAGALTLLADVHDPLLVINGDILTRIDFGAMWHYHLEHQAEITVGVREYDFRVPYGVVESDGNRVTAISEKPVMRWFVNAGIYLLQPAALQGLPSGKHCDMPTLINRHVATGASVVSFPVHEYWLDIGQLDDYHQADADVRRGLG